MKSENEVVKTEAKAQVETRARKKGRKPFRVGLLLSIMAMLSCIPAFADDGETVAASGMTAVVAAMSTVTELVSSVWTLMTSNALLTVFLAASLVSVGVAVFRAIKRAAQH